MSEKKTLLAWAILKESRNQLDGHRRYLDGDPVCATETRLFRSRAAARREVKERYGYIKDCEDLQKEPHGWRMPRVVQVRVTIEIYA